MIYWDTSALLKLYVEEDGSRDFVELLLHTKDQICVSAIAGVEALCALHRKEWAGDLKPNAARLIFKAFRRDFEVGRILEIPYGADVLDEARKLLAGNLNRSKRSPMRSLDSIHLASARLVKATALVATDIRLRQAASATRVKVIP